VSSTIPYTPSACQVHRSRQSKFSKTNKSVPFHLFHGAVFRRASPANHSTPARAPNTVGKMRVRATFFVLEALGFEACTRRHLQPNFGPETAFQFCCSSPVTRPPLPSNLAIDTVHQSESFLFLWNLGTSSVLNLSRSPPETKQIRSCQRFKYCA
jgi:hypothetical protein